VSRSSGVRLGIGEGGGDEVLLLMGGGGGLSEKEWKKGGVGEQKGKGRIVECVRAMGWRRGGGWGVVRGRCRECGGTQWWCNFELQGGSLKKRGKLNSGGLGERLSETHLIKRGRKGILVVTKECGGGGTKGWVLKLLMRFLGKSNTQGRKRLFKDPRS